MKMNIHYPLAWMLLCGVVCAQESSSDAPVAASSLDEYMETGTEASGVRAPYYDDEGNLKAQLYGGHAKILEGGVVEVSDIRIDVYEDATVTMTVYAPKCRTQVVEKGAEKILSVESDGYVLIEMDQMTVSGRGFRFSSEGSRFEIFSESKVLVKDTGSSVEGLEL